MTTFAWQKLADNSFLPDNQQHTAWEHLCSQIKGGVTVMVCDEFEVALDEPEMEIEVVDGEVEIVTEEAVEIELNEQEVEIDLCL